MAPLHRILEDTKLYMPVAQIHLAAHFIKWLVNQEDVQEFGDSVVVIDGKDYSGQLTMSAFKMIWDLSMVRPITASILAKIRFDSGEEFTIWLEVNPDVVGLSFILFEKE